MKVIRRERVPSKDYPEKTLIEWDRWYALIDRSTSKYWSGGPIHSRRLSSELDDALTFSGNDLIGKYQYWHWFYPVDITEDMLGPEEFAENPERRLRMANPARKTKIKLLHGLTATYKFIDFEDAPWGEGVARPHYKIILKCRGLTTSYDFWGSIRDYEEGKQELDESNLASAVEMIIGDAIAGEMTFDELVDEFGYDDPKAAYRVFKGVQQTAKKVKRIYDEDLYDLSNWIREQWDL